MEIPLAPNGQESQYIEEMFTLTDTSDFMRSVRCTAPPGEAMFTGVAVELDDGNHIFTTLPVVPVQRWFPGNRQGHPLPARFLSTTFKASRGIIAIVTMALVLPLAAMVSVKEILFRQPPEILYHYTGQKGLLGIIGKKEIWASHTQYLNDQREFRHAMELVRDELSQMARQADTQTGPFVVV